ncbi:MAG TPA: hypothetical protein VIV12_10945 [Streptosporangiaceae bacterium]
MAFPLPETITDGVTTGHNGHHVDLHKLLNNNTNVQAGTAYTLVLADFGKIIELTSATAVTVTIPPSSSVAFPTGTVVEATQLGTGVVTIAAGVGVTIRTPSTLVLRAQYSTVSLRLRAVNEWVLAGDTT